MDNHRDTGNTKTDINLLSANVIDAAVEVHKALGPGLLESAYHRCLRKELALRKIAFQDQLPLPVNYKGDKIDCGYRLDFMVDNRLILEIKSVERLIPIYEAQLLTYLRLTGLWLGPLINFNVPILKLGIKRMVNGYR